MPGRAAAEQQAITQIIADENRWLTLALMDAISLTGGPAITEAELPRWLPRLSGRHYADGTIILALDAGRISTMGTVLMGIGEGRLEQTAPGSFKWLRPLLDWREAAAYEHRQRRQLQGADDWLRPGQLMQLEPEDAPAPWAPMMSRMVQDADARIRAGTAPLIMPDFGAFCV